MVTGTTRLTYDHWSEERTTQWGQMVLKLYIIHGYIIWGQPRPGMDKKNLFKFVVLVPVLYNIFFDSTEAYKGTLDPSSVVPYRNTEM